MSKRYDVYYVLNDNYEKHIILSTDNIGDAIECYSNFIYDNCFFDKINYCVLTDNKFSKRIMYTDWLC